MNDFGRLLEKEIPRLRRYAFALTRNISGADDLVQDTLVRAIAKQHFWQRGTNLRAWLFTPHAQPDCRRHPSQRAGRYYRRGRRTVASPHSGNRSDRAAVVAGSRSRPRANSRGAAPGASLDWSR